MATGLLALILGGGLVFLALRLIRASRAIKASRAGYFNLVAPGMKDLRRAVQPTGFARVSGRINGAETDLQVVPDTLTWRKLPVLWLLATRPVPLPLRQRIHLMIRPRGVEPFSAFDTLPHQTALPEGMPYDAALRSEKPLSGQEAALLDRHRAIFLDPRVKELVLSPKGIRISWLADEAERGRYLIFREAEMGREPLSPVAIRPLLEALENLQDDIVATFAVAQSKEPDRKCA